MPASIHDISTLASELDIPVDYSDEDLVIIDNVRRIATDVEHARLPMNILVVCIAGRVRFDLSGVPTELTENQVLVCPPGTMLTNPLFSPDFEFKLLLVTNRLVQSFLRGKMDVWNRTLYVHKFRVLQLGSDDIRFFECFYTMLRLYIDSPNERVPYRGDLIRSLLRAGFLGLCGTISQMPAPSAPAHTAESLFARFLDLLQTTERKHRPIDYFADRLCVTPKYLSQVCKRATGKTAAQWITEYTLDDIRHYLRATDLPVKQVCDRLGFPNASFFGRYVRTHFGQTPLEYRASKV
ncbi:MAG: helix-turn-helix domain-containing protein [Bacteroidaceae bacterium]|nr:helix-turn-helix domain-containing protein [Bacteroidaceae bacterium]